ncbi:hypothetical protein WR25_23528 isoform B [Diploscapter pachys]|uniref:F-box domain-containing protein n=2 Tax=Diploscapter pachys TaxID=2018661 RepID=A0A2A2KW52_9BILA|nr:hypothetical protein WR25_23528 isoform B [Diploscapter pachys]
MFDRMPIEIKQRVLSHCPHADALCLLRVCSPLTALTQHYTHLQPGATFDNVDIVADVKQNSFSGRIFVAYLLDVGSEQMRDTINVSFFSRQKATRCRNRVDIDQVDMYSQIEHIKQQWNDSIVSRRAALSSHASDPAQPLSRLPDFPGNFAFCSDHPDRLVSAFLCTIQTLFHNSTLSSSILNINDCKVVNEVLGIFKAGNVCVEGKTLMFDDQTALLSGFHNSPTFYTKNVTTLDLTCSELPIDYLSQESLANTEVLICSNGHLPWNGLARVAAEEVRIEAERDNFELVLSSIAQFFKSIFDTHKFLSCWEIRFLSLYNEAMTMGTFEMLCAIIDRVPMQSRTIISDNYALICTSARAYGIRVDHESGCHRLSIFKYIYKA